MSEAAQLDAFLAAMTQYAPTIPDELVDFYLQQAGCTTNDVRMYVSRRSLDSLLRFVSNSPRIKK